MKTHKYLEDILKICESKHLTIEEIYQKIKKKHPEIGRVTIYRNVEYLVKEGKMRKIANINKTFYYETYKFPHVHLIDKKTGKIYDIKIEKINNLTKNIPVNQIYDIIIIGEVKKGLKTIF